MDESMDGAEDAKATSVLKDAFPDGLNSYCEDMILLAVVRHADKYGIAIGTAAPASLGIEDLARQAGVPLEAAKAAVEGLEATRALSRFTSEGREVWVLADPEDDAVGRWACRWDEVPAGVDA
ncbi:hypothetical protein ANMWB30_22920 [Arthrobacter sp. MWB30]|nr:hypothetical protein ANMWB30_22920 [Arthrobacter sp. MWB30]